MKLCLLYKDYTIETPTIRKYESSGKASEKA